MIEKEFAATQFSRMTQLDFPPTTREAIEDVLMAICTAENEDHAARVIDDIMSDRIEFPKPAEIRRMMYEMSERKESEKPKWEGTERPIVKEKNGYSCGFVCNGWGTVGERPNVRWCTCAHAEYLKRDIPNWLDLCNAMPDQSIKAPHRQSIPSWLYGMPGDKTETTS